jgi:hypothetical protein
VLCWRLQSQVSRHQSTVPVTVVLMAVNIWVHNQECRNCFFMLCCAQHCVRQLHTIVVYHADSCPRQALVEPRLHVNMARAGPALVCTTHSDNAPNLDSTNRLHVAWSQCIRAVSWNIYPCGKEANVVLQSLTVHDNMQHCAVRSTRPQVPAT